MTDMETSNTYTEPGDWLEKLRARFIEVAARRVGESDVEDVVQEAMRVVVEKRIVPGGEVVGELPPMAWCFQVLRNTIGNHYGREDTRRRRLVAEEHSASEVAAPARFAEEMDSRETLRVIEDALVEMGRSDPQCGRYLMRLVDDARPQAVAADEGLEPAVFYRRLYRCRQKLRGLLTARGVDI